MPMKVVVTTLNGMGRKSFTEKGTFEPSSEKVGQMSGEEHPKQRNEQQMPRVRGGNGPGGLEAQQGAWYSIINKESH